MYLAMAGSAGMTFERLPSELEMTLICREVLRWKQ
jgi:hypothetical protein